MSDLEGDFRATSEDIAADAARLNEIEEEKTHLDPGDPRAQELAEESERIARRLVPKTVAEREMTDQANGDTLEPSR
ncbi:MAG TPA: hypothetical protein VFN41_08780 [Candidatus Limnocylindrales bacterium]|nr:hypothetical protein [Candidatus Limnocylindrales bacterium]